MARRKSTKTSTKNSTQDSTQDSTHDDPESAPTNPNARCELRSWELVYEPVALDTDLREVFKQLCAKKFGILKGFGVIHGEGEKTHLHCGVITRDKPKSLKWKGVANYWKISVPSPQSPKIRTALKNKSNRFNRKLQQYYNYCIDPEKHVGQEISEPFFWKWTPKDPDEEAQSNPLDYLTDLIFDDLTLDELDANIDESDVWTQKVRRYALTNYDKLERMIDKLDTIRTRKRQAALYKEASESYRGFQKGLVKQMDEQGDRGIHNHFDPGDTGKNHFVTTENMRTDTLVMQNAETKRIAYAWDPKKHKRIIFDIPKHKMAFVNTSVIEKLKNGTLFSTMHKPKMKHSLFRPKILILGNEQINPQSWTADRVTYSRTTKESNYAYISETNPGKIQNKQQWI